MIQARSRAWQRTIGWANEFARLVPGSPPRARSADGLTARPEGKTSWDVRGRQPVEAPVLGLEWEDLHIVESRLQGVGAQRRGANDGAGGRGLGGVHGVRQAAHDATPVVVTLAIFGRHRELLA